MSIPCPNCGAHLEPSPDATDHLRCGYCGTAVPLPRPGVHVQVRTHAPRRTARPAQVRPALLALIGFGILLSIAGGLLLPVVAIPILEGAGSSARPGGATAPAPPSLPGILAPPRIWGTSTCLVDADGDGVLDVVGTAGTAGATPVPTLVDGATGRVIWEGETPKGDVRVFCPSERWFAVQHPDFTIAFHDARDPTTTTRVAARDEAVRVGVARGCVAVETADGGTLRVRLPGGTATRCRPKRWRSLRGSPPGVLGLTASTTSIQADDGRAYRLEKREDGTPILTVTALRRGQRLWRRELPWAACTFASGIAAGDEVVAVWGAEVADRDTGVLVGLDARTGRRRYAVPQADDVSGLVRFMAFNGRYVVVQWWTRLVGYEPATGETAWTFGA